MKKAVQLHHFSLTLTAILVASSANAATYYVDPNFGSDQYTGRSMGVGAGHGPQTAGPWRTVAKVNAGLAAGSTTRDAWISPGDTVKFKCGGVWNEALVVQRSGASASQPITFGAYGDCSSSAKPMFRLSTPVQQWTSQDGLIWRASLSEDISQVLVYQGGEGQVLPIARYPKISAGGAGGPDMLRVQSDLTCGSLNISTSNQGDTDFPNKTCGLAYSQGDLQSKPSLVGADLVLRAGSYFLDRRRIRAQDTNAGQLIWGSATGVNTSTTPRLQWPTTYNLSAGFGYFATGLPWMIGEAGEWAVERGNSLFLSLRPLSGAMPPDDDAASGAVRVTPLRVGKGPIGINAENQQFLIFNDLQVVDAAIGMELSGSSNVTVSRVRVARSAYVGLRADSSHGLALTDSTIQQSGFIGLTALYSVNFTATGNQVVDIGTHVPPNGETISGGLYSTYGGGGESYYGVRLEKVDNANIHGNRIANSAYVGIRASQVPTSSYTTVLDANTIENSCLYLDDCGAIYTDGRNAQPNQLTISNNLVLGAGGSLTGRPLDANSKPAGSSAAGIYLDDFSRAVNISGNLITDTDQAIQGHLARESWMEGNVLFASRKRGIWFQEELWGGQYPVDNGYAAGNMCPDPANCIVENTIRSNLIVDLPKVPAYHLESTIGGTNDFGAFDFNRYANVFSGFGVLDQPAQGAQLYNWTTWQSARNADLSGSAMSRRLALQSNLSATGQNQTTFGGFDTNVAGWDSWSTDMSQHLNWISDTGGGHARLQAVNNQSIASLNGLNVTAGRDYVVRFKMRTPSSGFAVKAVLRNDKNYGDIAPWQMVSPSTDWQIYVATVRATGTADGVTLDVSGQIPKARLDFEIPQGQTIEFDDVFVSEVQSQTAAGGFDAGLSSWDSRSPNMGHHFSWVTDSTGGHGKIEAADFQAVLILNNLRTVANHDYVVRFAMRTQTPGFSVKSVLRNDQNYTDISPWQVVSPDSNWNTYFAVLRASETLDGQTVDINGHYPKARLDFEVPAGQMIEIDDVFVAEVSPTPVPARTLLRLFAGGRIGADGQLGPTSFDCPDAGTSLAARCSLYLNLRSGQMISWPVTLGSNTAAASIPAVILDPDFADSDGDGVADRDDACPLTSAGATVDERGCSYAQRH